MIVVGAERFQRGVGIQHAAAARAQHVPGKIEQPHPRRMEEAGNHPLFVEPGALRKIQHVDTVKLVVFALIDQPSDGIGDRGVGGLLQYRNLGLDLAHTERLDGSAGAAMQCPEPVRYRLNHNRGSSLLFLRVFFSRAGILFARQRSG